MQGNNKFFFDLNNFDEPDDDINEEDLVPSFSEEELQAAKDLAFKEGKAEGIREEKASREQITQQILSQIKQQLSSLQSAEIEREQIYEEESLRLFQNALKHIFPTLNSRLGFEEMLAMIERVIEGQKGQTHITITVPNGFESDIQSLLDERASLETKDTKYIVKEDAALDQGGCKLTWQDGGAVRDANTLIQNMLLEVDRLLPEQSSPSLELQKDDIKEEDIDPTPSIEDQNGDKNE